MNYLKMQQLMEEFMNQQEIMNILDNDPMEEEILTLSLSVFHEFYNDKNNKIFPDLEKLERLLLVNFPQEVCIFPDEAINLYFWLVSFFQFLYRKEAMTEKAYTEALLCFQKNALEFVYRMGDPDHWGSEKTQDMSVMEEDIEQQAGQFFADAFSEFSTMFDDSQKKKEAVFLDQPSKVISFDAAKNKKKANENFDQPMLMQPIYQIRVDLKGFKPPIWRRLLVEGAMTYAELHMIIQLAFEWENYHLYEFNTPNHRISENKEEQVLFLENIALDPLTTMIDEDLLTFKKLNYTYDFGDDWEHVIKLEKVFRREEIPSYILPLCIKGKGDSPSEDSRSFIDAGEDAATIFVPFDIDEVNLRLQKFLSE